MRWSDKTEIPTKRFAGWLGIGKKLFAWKKRYGKVNEHNGKVPRDHWIEGWERDAILDYHDRNTLEGYRRLAFMMLDHDVVAVSPSTVYRTLKGLRNHRRKEPAFTSPHGLSLGPENRTYSVTSAI